MTGASLSSKVWRLYSLVRNIFLYVCVSWTLTADLQRRTQTVEMRCSCKMLNISYKDHVTNKEVHAKIQQAIRPHEALTIIKRHNLKWYGHVSRSSGLAQIILQGTMKGGRRQVDRRIHGQTTSGNGQAWSSQSPRRQQKKEKKTRGNLLWNFLWCPNNSRS